MRRFRCFDCGYEWEEPYGTGKGTEKRCPKCGSTNVHRTDSAAGTGPRGQGAGRGQGGTQGYGQGRGGRSGMGRGRL